MWVYKILGNFVDRDMHYEDRMGKNQVILKYKKMENMVFLLRDV